MSFIRKRRGHKKPGYIHKPSDYVIDTYFWIYLTNIGYWLTRFFNVPFILVILLFIAFRVWDTNILINVVGFLGYAFDVGLFTAIEYFEWLPLANKGIFTIIFFGLIFAAFGVVFLWKHLFLKGKVSSFISIVE